MQELSDHPTASNFCLSCGGDIVSGERLKYDDGSYIWVCENCTGYPFIAPKSTDSKNSWNLYNTVVDGLQQVGMTRQEALRQMGEGVVVKGIPFAVKFKDTDSDLAMPNVCPKCGEEGTPYIGIAYNPMRVPYKQLRWAHYLGRRGGKTKVKWCYVRSLGRAKPLLRKLLRRP